MDFEKEREYLRKWDTAMVLINSAVEKIDNDDIELAEKYLDLTLSVVKDMKLIKEGN